MHTKFCINLLNKGLRILRIWKTVIILIILLWWDARSWTYLGGFSIHQKQIRQAVRAKWLTNELIKLGSAFIKVGQLLSARPDVLPSGWVSELADLQDKVPPFSFRDIQFILQAELGKKFKSIVHLEEDPIGAASLAQVHRGSLNNGRSVVFKVQRPGLQKLFRLDLLVMQQVAALIQRHPRWGKGRDWVGIAKESQRVLLRELDFRLEAEYAARFRQQFLDNDQIKVPQVIWDLSTEKILCLDYVPGIKINSQQELIDAEIDPKKIAELGATSYLQQLVTFGFFHADPHPGNLAVASDGALIYYDFGMMGVISESLRNRLGKMIKAAASKNTSALIEELQEAGLIAPEVDLGPVRRLVRLMLKEALSPPFQSNIIEKLSGDLYELVYGQPFRVPVELIFVMRALSTFEGVGRSLDPSFNLMTIAQPYLLPLMNSSGSNSNDFINEIGRQVGVLGSKAAALPKRLDDSLEKLEQGDLQLQIRMGESDRQLRRIVTAQHSIGQSFLLGCLGISAALLGASNRPHWAIFPLLISLPIGLGWLKLQFKLGRDNRLDRIHDKNSDQIS